MTRTLNSPDWFLDHASPEAFDAASPEMATGKLVRPAPRGRTRILPRALRQIASMVTAESLGVSPREVSVELGDDHGMLALTIRTPIQVVALRRVLHEPKVVDAHGGTILERSAVAHWEIRRRVGELTGFDIGQVTVHLTGTNIARDRRVR